MQAQRFLIKEGVDKRINTVLEHGKFILGPEVNELESELIDFTGTDYCITCANGTDALQLALMALGVGQGDEIITSAFSFIATSEAIAILGAKPVYVDIDPVTFNIDPIKVEAAISSKTRAIMAVSLFGQCADFDLINEIAAKHNLAVIEDAAQSFGALYNGKRSCNLTTVSCTSFFPSKPLGCYGDGGAVFTNDESLAKVIRQIARHGQEARYNHVRIGLNSRLDTLQAAILLEKLKIFNDELEARDKVARYYNENLSGRIDENDYVLPKVRENSTSAWAQYTLRVKEREKLQKRLKQQGVPSVIHYPKSLNNQPAVKDINVSVPKSEKTANEVLSIPMHPYMDNDIQDYIISAILD